MQAELLDLRGETAGETFPFCLSIMYLRIYSISLSIFVCLSISLYLSISFHLCCSGPAEAIVIESRMNRGENDALSLALLSYLP